MNYTKHQLQKIEDLLVEVGYQVRYEKGSFQSGYCLVENRKIAIVNKFFETEGRINTLLDIIDKIEINTEGVSEKAQKTLKEIKKAKGADEGKIINDEFVNDEFINDKSVNSESINI